MNKSDSDMILTFERELVIYFKIDIDIAQIKENLELSELIVKDN